MRSHSLAIGLIVIAGLMGCAARSPTNPGARVELTAERPPANCVALGEAAGSQGKWFTGNYTSSENLMVGARNDLHNRAAKMGGNLVHVQNQDYGSSRGREGTTTSTVVRMVYRCP